MAGLWLDLVALVGGTVHSMVPGEAPRIATVLVRDGRIQAIVAEFAPTEDMRIVEVRGRHLLPGLIDGFAYHDPGHDALYLAAGVTCIVDHGNDIGRILDQRSRAARDRAPGPWIVTAGAVIDGLPPSTNEALIARTVGDLDGILPVLLGEHQDVQGTLDTRVDFFAFGIGLDPSVWRELLVRAKSRSYRVFGPLPRQVTLLGAAEAGQDGVLFLDGFLTADATWESFEPASASGVIGELARRGTWVMPLLSGTARWVGEPDESELTRLAPAFRAQWIYELALRRAAADPKADRARAEAALAKQRELLQRLERAGVHLVPGSGAPHPWLAPGRGFLAELSQWCAAGLSPARVLALATRGAAEAYGLAGERGSIAPGMVADILVLSKDPEADLAHLADPELVVLRGRGFDAEELARQVSALVAEQARAVEAHGRPLEIEAPTPPRGEVVLAGTSESFAHGTRVSGERWLVAREENGSLWFHGRMLTPASGSGAEARVDVRQKVSGGRLTEFEITLESGAHRLVVRGLFTAEAWRVERTLDEKRIDLQTVQEKIALVDVGSLSSLLCLAHTQSGGAFPVLRFHEGLQLEVVRWDLAIDEQGRRFVRTPSGGKLVSFAPDGSIELAIEQRGSGETRTQTLSVEAPAGGLPVPALAPTPPKKP